MLFTRSATFTNAILAVTGYKYGQSVNRFDYTPFYTFEMHERPGYVSSLNISKGLPTCLLYPRAKRILVDKLISERNLKVDAV